MNCITLCKWSMIRKEANPMIADTVIANVEAPCKDLRHKSFSDLPTYRIVFA